MLTNVVPLNVIEKRVGFYLGNIVETESFFRIRLEKALDEIFSLLRDHSLFITDLRPLNFTFQDVLKDLLNLHGSKGRNSNHDFICYDS